MGIIQPWDLTVCAPMLTGMVRHSEAERVTYFCTGQEWVPLTSPYPKHECPPPPWFILAPMLGVLLLCLVGSAWALYKLRKLKVYR